MKIAVIILVISMTYALAHPVIYKDGWVYQGMFMPEINENSLGYSFDPHYSVTMKSNSFENDNGYRDYTIGANTLLKRWYQEDSQGNLYLIRCRG